MNTRNLRFYHGTSAAAALSILSSGARNYLEEIGCSSLAAAIWSTILSIEIQGEMWRRFLKHDEFLEGTSWTTLKSLAGKEERPMFQYGDFYVTLDLGRAYGYAGRNPIRSESLLALSHGLKFLEYEGATSTVSKLRDLYPGVMELIDKPTPPVVLELTGIVQSRLSNEDGTKDVDAKIEAFFDLPDTPASFRISNVVPADIVAVHDLRDWSPEDILPPPWKPELCQS